MNRKRIVPALMALVALSLTPLAVGSPALAGPPTWHLSKVIGPSSDGEMSGVFCVSATRCFATSQGGEIYSTSNGWSNVHKIQAQGTHVADTMAAVTCVTPTTCVAVGGWGTNTTGYGIVTRTSNGGSSWVPEHPSTTWPLYAVSCPSTSLCYAAGARNGHEAYWMKSTDGGVTWAAHVGISSAIGVLSGISCNGVSFCSVVSSVTPSATTLNGGTTWSLGVVATHVRYLFGISCVLSSDCVAVGATTSGKGVALRSTDGGLHWTQMSVPSSVSTLYGVTCLSATECFAVGRTGSTDQNGKGVVLTSTNGVSWSPAPLPVGSSALLAIACRTASGCTAVGGTP